MPTDFPEMDALAKLLDEHGPRLLAMVKRRIDGALTTRISAETILSDAFLAARDKWHRYETHGAHSPFAWLYRIVLDCLIEQWRHHTRGVRNVRLEMPWPDQSSVQMALRLVDSGTSPSQAMARLELQERMRQALDLLKDVDREILQLRYFDSLSFPEAAEVLNISVSAATVRYVRALERLTSLWKKLHPQQDAAP